MNRDFSFLRTALPYIKIFKDTHFVFKIGGDICENESALSSIIEEIGILFHLGMKPIVVHGGGKQATELGEKLGIESSFVSGRRVTSKEMIEVVKMSFAGTINTNLVSTFEAKGLPSVGITGIDGGLISATKRPSVPVDFGYVGDIKSVNPSVVLKLSEQGFIPIIASLASDNAGTILNINGDTLASEIAVAMHAEKLIFLTPIDGVMKDITNPSTLFSLLTASDAEVLIRDEVAKDGMIPKLQNCIEVIKRGVSGAHIINGLKKDSILQEIFTNEGCGTMVIASS